MGHEYPRGVTAEVTRASSRSLQRSLGFTGTALGVLGQPPIGLAFGPPGARRFADDARPGDFGE
jgi:hypothetical protein